MLGTGRVCPLDYELGEEYLRKILRIDRTCYIVGGLYGNYQALEEIERMAELEDAQIIFNGDSHWFDRDLETFKAIEEALKRNIALLGNVEMELVRDGGYNGCGCGYPGYVSDETVRRSNEIHASLFELLKDQPKIREDIKKREKSMVLDLDGLKILVTHGDEKSLSGWACDKRALKNKERQEDLKTWLESKNIDLMASSHTCSPAFLDLDGAMLMNNGASGMPNFKGQIYGLLTRISREPSVDPIYSKFFKGFYIEALAIRYDSYKFSSYFSKLWPKGSPAALSYGDRIAQGPDNSLENSLIKNLL